MRGEALCQTGTAPAQPAAQASLTQSSKCCSELTGSAIFWKGPAEASAKISITAGAMRAVQRRVLKQWWDKRVRHDLIVTHNISGNTQWASSSFTSSLCSHGCSYQHQVHNILVYLFAVCHSAAFHSQVGLETWLMVKVLDFQNIFHQSLDLLNRARVFSIGCSCGSGRAALENCITVIPLHYTE